ncbi:MAG: hypothetical protein WCE53_03725 [Candidatus Acidiferrum sp.]
MITIHRNPHRRASSTRIFPKCHRCGLGLRYTCYWGFAEFGGTGVGRQGSVDTDLNETPTPGYGLLNARLGVLYQIWTASVVADNLLNRFYYENLSYYRDPFAFGGKFPNLGETSLPN